MPASSRKPLPALHVAVDSVARFGSYGVNMVIMTGQLFRLFVQSVDRSLRDPQRGTVLLAQMYRMGYQSLPVVVLTGVSIALVLAIQGYATLNQFNAENITGGMVNFTIISQIMPVLTGLVLAGRVGSSIAAEIGTMKVTEQLDALRVMGTDPISYLVVPRLLACMFLMPLITAIGALIGIIAAAMLITQLYGVYPADYWHHTQEFVTWWEILTGLGKTMVYGVIIALVACRHGLRTDGGATGVGESCTRAVVDSSMLILFTTFLLTVILQRLSEFIFG